jgi:5-methyltetrahydropteroyltriglutamate--homocysteine methyltransferase
MVVSGYPALDWIVAAPTELAPIDATQVVLHTQEQAGIDIVCDGELCRIDVNHPATNGMIEYFVRPISGVRTAIDFDGLVAYREQTGMSIWLQPLGLVDGPISHGTLDFPGAQRRACQQVA